MKRLASILLLLFLTFSAFAVTTKSALLDATRYSALRSVSYHGTLEDIQSNPAALCLVTYGDMYSITSAISEAYDTTIFASEKLPYIQNMNQEIHGMVVSSPIALTAKGSFQFDDRKMKDSDVPNFDVYSSIDMEIDLAYSYFNHFAFGVMLGGGNSLVRMNKEISDPLVAVENAWFSPFESTDGSGRYNVGLGLLGYYRNYTLGFYSRDIVLFNGTLTDTLRSFFGDGTASFSYEGNTYSKEGDLLFLVPRASISLKGFLWNVNERSISLKGDVTLQFLKNMFLDVGVGFSYRGSSTESETIYSVSTYAEYYDYAIGVELAYIPDSKETVHPSIYFTFSH